MHQRVREEFWDASPTSNPDNEALIAEKHVCIRPAPGYPAFRSGAHREDDAALAADRHQRTGIELTESMAMARRGCQRLVFLAPAVAVFSWSAGWLQDQVADYAKRKGWTLAEAERWLSSNSWLQPGRTEPQRNLSAFRAAHCAIDIAGVPVSSVTSWLARCGSSLVLIRPRYHAAASPMTAAAAWLASARGRTVRR